MSNPENESNLVDQTLNSCETSANDTTENSIHVYRISISITNVQHQTQVLDNQRKLIVDEIERKIRLQDNTESNALKNEGMLNQFEFNSGLNNILETIKQAANRCDFNAAADTIEKEITNSSQSRFPKLRINLDGRLFANILTVHWLIILMIASSM